MVSSQRVAVLVVDLRPAGDAGPHAVALPVVGDLLVQRADELGPLRAGPDNRHLALEDVEELRQLVEADRADDAAHRRDARVVFLRPDGAGADFGIGAHGAEFVDREQRAIQADARLAVEHRARRGEPDRQRGEQHEGRGKRRCPTTATQHVGKPLVQQVLAARTQFAGEDQLRRADFLEADTSADPLVGVGGLFDDVAGETQFQQFADRHAVAPLEHADHDAVRLGSAHDVAQGRPSGRGRCRRAIRCRHRGGRPHSRRFPGRSRDGPTRTGRYLPAAGCRRPAAGGRGPPRKMRRR